MRFPVVAVQPPPHIDGEALRGNGFGDVGGPAPASVGRRRGERVGRRVARYASSARVARRGRCYASLVLAFGGKGWLLDATTKSRAKGRVDAIVNRMSLLLGCSKPEGLGWPAILGEAKARVLSKLGTGCILGQGASIWDT